MTLRSVTTTRKMKQSVQKVAFLQMKPSRLIEILTDTSTIDGKMNTINAVGGKMNIY